MLTFLNTYLLPVLSLAALPILIHLFTRHKTREQLFSDLRFLNEIHRRQMRRIKLRQWLLLILRTLALLCILAAFTRPAIRNVSFGNKKGHEPTAIAILVDNSYSTGAVRSNADIFTHEKAIAKKILAVLEEGDMACVGTFSDKCKWLTPKPTRFYSNLAAILDTASLSDRGTDISAAIEQAAEMLKQQNMLHSEIYLITDNIENSWRNGIAKLPDNIPVNVFAIEADKPENRTVTQIDFPPQLLEANSTFDITAGIKNNRDKSATGIVASLVIDGRKNSQQFFDMAPEALQTVTLSAQSGNAGFHWGFVELSSDNLTTDNRRYVTFRIPEKVRVLIVGDASTRKFIKFALAPEGESKFFALTERSDATLGQEPLENYDVIVLCSPQKLSPAALQKTRAFASSGGGVLIFPGEKSAASPTDFSQLLANFGNIVFDGFLGDTTSNALLRFGKVDFTHPVFSIFEQTGLPEAEVGKFLSFEIRDGRSLAFFDNGKSAVSELALGDGRVLLCGFSPELAWGNVALSGFFVPVVQRFCQYLASDAAYFDTGFLVGSKAARTLQDFESGKIAILLPGGGEIFVLPKFVGGKATVFVDELPRAGVYAITANGDTVDLFCANVDGNEGDLTPLDIAERKKIKVNWLDADADIGSQVLSTRYGFELWRPLLILALLFLAAEMLVEKLDIFKRPLRSTK